MEKACSIVSFPHSVNSQIADSVDFGIKEEHSIICYFRNLIRYLAKDRIH